MFYPEEVINDLRMNSDIVRVIGSYVTLTPKGLNHFGLCPFHNEKSPSFSVSSEKQLYHCFGCGASGNVYTFIMQIERLNFTESIEFLAQMVNYQLPKNSSESNREISEKNEIYKMHEDANNLYKNLLFDNKDTSGIKYLKQRNISDEMIEKFSLGYASSKSDILYNFLLSNGYDIDLMIKSGLIVNGKNGYYDRFYGRVMFPIFDTSNRVSGFGGRTLDESKGAKYLNSSASPIFYKDKMLYGLNFAKTSKRNDLILVEGYLDVIKLFQFGFDNAIASLGTAFNENHVRTISQYKKDVVISFDADEAGVTATKKAISVLAKTRPDTKVISIKNAKDPDEFLEKYGAEEFQILLDEKQNYIDYLINKAKDNYNFDDVNQKAQFTNECVKIISHIKNEITLDAYIKKISKISDISVKAIEKEVKKSGNVANSDELVQKPISKNRSNYGKSTAYPAKKSLITMMISNKKIFELVNPLLEPKELGDDLLEKIYLLIIDSYKKNIEILLCDYLNFFETVEEQRLVSEIFNTCEEFLIDDKIIKASTDLLKAIKKEYYNNLLSKEDNPDEIALLLNKIKSVDKITL